MKELGAIVLALVAMLFLWLFYDRAEAQPADVYTCTTNTGQRIYRGGSDLAAFGYCKLWILRGNGPWATWGRDGAGTDRLKIFTAKDQGVWTWVAPTALENGNKLTDLSHYLLYRQPPAQPAAVWAQVDGRAARLLVPMGPADFGACFWVVAVRKPATSPAVPSDKSNTICMDAVGQPLPST